MYNLVMKDMKLAVHPLFILFPFVMGALMFIPSWLYFIVIMYFFWVSAPNLFAQYRTQNDLLFTAMLPVSKKDMVKARVSVIVILELLHIVTAMIYGLFRILLFPNDTYYFFAPHMGFWGLCFVMLAIYNIILIPMHYKTAYKYGMAQLVSILAAMAFAGVAQWIQIQSPFVSDIFNGSGANNTVLQISILVVGIVIFMACTMIAYRIAIKRFLKVELQ
ncbi:hypothetical protein E0485_08515 [Paenibacillus albiflavus]|uniref:ABC-2 transporter permease n=1 Tax=Paenibacillus albiflavus TaxID=2545760 RepID=A0A4R4EEH5_9BACL|nr:ABC-2 transporter permease [Paenibacillus albiflavus]TCZ78159.1 hypothetical protein E0485_08515 [Paenibacillus albiflavus]